MAVPVLTDLSQARSKDFFGFRIILLLHLAICLMQCPMAKKLLLGKKAIDQSDVIYLDELKEGSVGPVIAMVARKWDVHKPNGDYLGTDFIISDEKGNLMHCFSRHNKSYKFVDRLHEGGLFTLKGFKVHFKMDLDQDPFYIVKDEIQDSVITIEPGVYIPHNFDCAQRYQGIGIRVEDEVLITESGHEVLTGSLPKEMSHLETLLNNHSYGVGTDTSNIFASGL